MPSRACYSKAPASIVLAPSSSERSRLQHAAGQGGVHHMTWELRESASNTSLLRAPRRQRGQQQKLEQLQGVQHGAFASLTIHPQGPPAAGHLCSNPSSNSSSTSPSLVRFPSMLQDALSAVQTAAQVALPVGGAALALMQLTTHPSKQQKHRHSQGVNLKAAVRQQQQQHLMPGRPTVGQLPALLLPQQPTRPLHQHKQQPLRRGADQDDSEDEQSSSIAAKHLQGSQQADEQQRHHPQQQQQQQQRVDPWHSGKLLLSGAMSAVVSRTFVAPLERVKMELMLKQGAGGALATATQVLRTEGVPGFWKGNALNILRTAPFKAVNFCAFDTLHRALSVLTGRDGNLERFAAGAMAGITATVVCFPLDLVRTRLMARTRGPYYGPGPFRTLAGIIRHEGAAALYTGCLPAVLGMAPAGAVFYGVYDLLKTRHLAALNSSSSGSSLSGGVQVQQQVSVMYTLLYGAMAGAASELFVYPLEVVRRRMQMQSMAMAHMAISGAVSATSRGAMGAAAMHAHGHTLQSAAAAHSALGVPAAAQAQTAAATMAASKGWARVASTCAAIMKAEGLAGFYVGLGPNMLQVLPSAAISYYVYETVKQALGAMK